MKTLVLIATMTVNGLPHGQPINLIATTESCRSELATLQGINQAMQGSGVVWIGRCAHIDADQQ